MFEGPDGSGKSTQIRLLKEYLDKIGHKCLVTREPGGTRISEDIRALILNPDYEEMSSVTEMMLYAAARAQLVHEVIGPAIERGETVISDRFVDLVFVLSRNRVCNIALFHSDSLYQTLGKQRMFTFAPHIQHLVLD